MTLRPCYERKCSSDPSNSEHPYTLTMQASSGHTYQAGNVDGSSVVSLTLPTIRSPAEGSGSTGEVAITLRPADYESEGRSGSRHTRPTIRLNSRHGHTHSNSSDATQSDDPHNIDNRENSNNLSEVLHVYQWLYKSFPYILIFSAKLLVQHLTGISVGIGLLTTFLYANKCIVNQVFLRDKCSKIQCIWLLFFLYCSSFLIYYTFPTQALYYSLIFLNPTTGPLQFWDVLWVVGITDFVVKFIFMGFKCLVLLVPSMIMSHKCKGYWYMCLEELAQYYIMFALTPVWFRYLIDYGAQRSAAETSGAVTSAAEWHFGVLLALLYLILKFFAVFGQFQTSVDVIRLFFTQPSYGVAASKRQCSEVNDVCAMCRAEFKKPTVLLCQHIFCEECVSLWLNREKTCPLCHTVISSRNHRWKDGATSLQLRLF